MPVPSSHTMKLRSDTIISTSLLFKLIISSRSSGLTTDEVEKKLKSYRNGLLLIEYWDRKVYNEAKVKELPF